MDNIKLNKDQLLIVKQFIEKRGFSDGTIMLNILDHFACKIEEVMNEKPGMTLEDAMTKAHRSFGIKGFSTLAETYVQTQNKKYKGIYQQQLKTLAGSVPFIITLLIAGVIFYPILRWTMIHGYYHLMEINDALLAFLICIVSVRIYFQIRNRKKGQYRNKNNKVFWGNIRFDFFYPTGVPIGLFWIYCFYFHGRSLHLALPISTIFFLIIVWTEAAYYQAMKKVNAEGDANREMYDRLFN